MAKKSIQQKAKEHFDKNPNAEAVHYTSDGFGFGQKQNAKAHASILEDKTITTATKNGEVPEDAEIVAAKKAEKEAKAKADEAKAKQEAAAKEKASLNDAGEKKNAANTGSDQKTKK